MITNESREIVLASVPLLREHGETITKLFYQKMFTAHPELKNLFNMSNQANGQQQQALAAAVYAYAANIDNPAALEPVLSRIAHKHAALGVTPAQYTIVGRHLLEAVFEVLGELATPAVRRAWDEAYWLLACELISREARLYHEQQPGGHGEFETMRVARVQKENEAIRSIYLEPVNGQAPAHFAPGQYVSVAITDTETGLRQLRQYSLSDAPGRDHWRITVKHEPGDPAHATPAGCVSTRMHQLREGELINVSAPYGDFQLKNPQAATPVVFLSAGVGVTPIASMINHLAELSSKRPIRLAHAARDVAYMALGEDIAQAARRLADFQAVYFYEHNCPAEKNCFQGMMDLTQPGKGFITPDAEVYMCGPLPFMREQRRALIEQGIAPEAIHYEVFGPDLLAGLN